MKKSLVVHFLFVIIFLVIMFINDFSLNNVNRVFILIFFAAWIVLTLYLAIREKNKK